MDISPVCEASPRQFVARSMRNQAECEGEPDASDSAAGDFSWLGIDGYYPAGASGFINSISGARLRSRVAPNWGRFP